MHHHIQRLWDGIHMSSTVAMVSALAALIYIPYALSKGPLTGAIVAEGWSLAGMTPEQTALLVHLFETVPLLLIVLGLVSLHVEFGGRGRLVTAGLSVTLLGFGGMIFAHFLEHLLQPLTFPVWTGGADWFIWCYYLGWFTLSVGFGIYGAGLLRVGTTPSWLAVVFVLMLPVSMGVGFTVTVLDVFTAAGTFRTALGVMWFVVGLWLWQVRVAPSEPTSPQSR